MIDAAELCRNAHESGAWREAAEDTFTRLSDYIGMLNSDETLYAVLDTIVNDRAAFGELSAEEQRFALMLKAEFERDGIQLRPSEREAVRSLNQVTEQSNRGIH